MYETQCYRADTEGTTAPQQTRGVCKVGSKLIPCVCDKLLLLSTMNSCEDKNTLWWELCNRNTVISLNTNLHSQLSKPECFEEGSFETEQASKLTCSLQWHALCLWHHQRSQPDINIPLPHGHGTIFPMSSMGQREGEVRQINRLWHCMPMTDWLTMKD